MLDKRYILEFELNIQGVVVDVIGWKLNLQLPMQSVHITTIVVSSNTAHCE